MEFSFWAKFSNFSETITCDSHRHIEVYCRSDRQARTQTHTSTAHTRTHAHTHTRTLVPFDMSSLSTRIWPLVVRACGCSGYAHDTDACMYVRIRQESSDTSSAWVGTYARTHTRTCTNACACMCKQTSPPRALYIRGAGALRIHVHFTSCALKYACISSCALESLHI